jgi:transposase-like protein
LERRRNLHQRKEGLDVSLPSSRLSLGNTLEFLLSPTRDAEAAKRFFKKALHSYADSAPRAEVFEEKMALPLGSVSRQVSKSTPRVINVDKNGAYPKAIADLKVSRILPAAAELRQTKYLNSLVSPVV